MPIKILFICSGNTCRSPLAEMLCRRILEEEGIEADIRSAGIITMDGIPWSEHSLSIAAELGLDSRGRSSTQVNAELLQQSDLILVMAVRHLDYLRRSYPGLDLEAKTFLLKKYLGLSEQEGLDVADPYGENISAYRAVAGELERLLKRLPGKLKAV